MRYFKVKYGYDKSAYSVIEEGGDLERAIYAWTEQIPVSLGGKMVHGKSIIAIEPHYHAHTGWNEFYEPKDGDDWLQIKRDCPNYDGVIEHYKQHVAKLVSSNQQHLIGQGKVPEQVEAPNQAPLAKLTSPLADKLKIQ